jgi:hypothetical protein
MSTTSTNSPVLVAFGRAMRGHFLLNTVLKKNLARRESEPTANSRNL